MTAMEKGHFDFIFTHKNVQQLISDHLHHVLHAVFGQGDAFHAPAAAPGEEESRGGHGVFSGSGKEGWA